MNLQRYAIVAALIVCGSLSAQTIDFGRSSQPADNEAIDDLIYYGEEMEFLGAYHEGDTVGDFTVYDFDGNGLNLYETLENGKPTLMMSISASCPRATNGFLPNAASSGLYEALQQLITEHYDDFNWIMVYGVEAHPTVGECPSNCPPGIYNDTIVYQHETYLYRRYAALDLQNSPAHNFPFTIYADNPDNSVYNNFFQRPFGLTVVNCEGIVEMRGDWAHNFVSGNFHELTGLIGQGPCAEAPDEEEEEENPDGETTFVGGINASEALRLWPNPAGEFVSLELPQRFGNGARVRIVDGYGRVVLDENFLPGKQVLPLSNVAKGVLVVELTGNGLTERTRLIHH